MACGSILRIHESDREGIYEHHPMVKKTQCNQDTLSNFLDLLAKDYGRSKTYTPQQIRKTIERHDLNMVYSCYAISMFSSQEDFNQFHSEMGENCDYEAMRSEIAQTHFPANAEMTYADVADSFFENRSYGEHDSSHDVGNGDGHGSH